MKFPHKYSRVIKRGQRAWKIAQAASKVLKNKYGATRVILFGSLVKGSRFTPWSDVDLSVSGLPPASYYKAAGEIMDMGMAKGIRIDVLDPVDCLKTMRNRIRQEGIEKNVNSQGFPITIDNISPLIWKTDGF